MKELGVGIVGFGFMGKAHTYGYKTIPFYYDAAPFKAKLVGVCSRREETVQKAKEEFGFEFATTDFDRLLEREDIQVINVCTPNVNHKEQIVKALKAGKHVYCDKPMVVSSKEAEEIIEVANSCKDVIHQVAFQNRFFPVTIRAKQLISEGRLGKILSFRAVYLHSGSVDKEKPIGWKQDASYGGGVLGDLGSHVIDLLYFLIGEYGSISSKTHVLYDKRPDKSGNQIEITAEDMFMMMAVMKNGAVGTVEASKIATGTNDDLRIEIHGDKGAIRFNLMEPNWLEYYDNTVMDQPMGGVKGFTKIECVQRYERAGATFPPSKLSIGWLRAHVHSLYSFLDCVYKGVQANPSLLDGAYIQKVMERVHESNAKQTWLDV